MVTKRLTGEKFIIDKSKGIEYKFVGKQVKLAKKKAGRKQLFKSPSGLFFVKK